MLPADQGERHGADPLPAHILPGGNIFLILSVIFPVHLSVDRIVHIAGDHGFRQEPFIPQGLREEFTHEVFGFFDLSLDHVPHDTARTRVLQARDQGSGSEPASAGKIFLLFRGIDV